MPFELTNQGDFLLARLYGVLTAADLNRIAIELDVVEDSNTAAMDRISDITSVERFEIGFPEIYSLAARRRARRFSKSVKSAIIVRDPVQFGLARMFQMLNDNPRIEIRIMHSVTEARDWFADKPATGTP